MLDTMTMMNISKRKGPVDRTYVAGLNGKKVALYAASLAAAKQVAVEHFRPKKKDAGLLWVELAD